MEKPVTVSVQHVSKTFRVLSSKLRVRVLDDLSFNSNFGQLILLVGKNGSGKSTLLRMIANIIKPSSGKIIVKGKIGYYPQNPSFNKGISALDFANYLGSLKDSKYTKKDGIKWLANFGITEKWYNIDTLLLSEGMRRRVALGLSFLGNPDILLLDEPLENLDKDIKGTFISLLQTELTNGKTVIVASHDIQSFLPLKPIQINLERGKAV